MATEGVRQPHKPMTTVSYSNVVSGARPNVSATADKKLDDDQFPTVGEGLTNGVVVKEEVRSTHSPPLTNGHSDHSDIHSPAERRGRSRNKLPPPAKQQSAADNSDISAPLPNGRHHSSDDCGSDKEGAEEKNGAEATAVVLKPAPPPAENAWFKRKSEKTPPPQPPSPAPITTAPLTPNPGKNSPAPNYHSSPHKVTLVARNFLDQLNAAVAAAIQNSTVDTSKPSSAHHRGNYIADRPIDLGSFEDVSVCPSLPRHNGVVDDEGSSRQQ